MEAEPQSGAVDGPGSAPGESNSNSTPGTSEAPAQVSPQGDESTPGAPRGGQNVPYDRFAEVNRRYRQTEEQNRQMAKELAELRGGVNQFQEHLLLGLGVKQPSKPEYVEKSTLDSLKSEYDKKLETQRSEMQMSIQLDTDFEKAQGKFPEAFETPGFVNLCLDIFKYGQTGKRFYEIAAIKAKELSDFEEKRFSARQAKYMAQKDNDARVAPMKPGGGSVAAGDAKHDLSTRSGRKAKALEILRSRKSQ